MLFTVFRYFRTPYFKEHVSAINRYENRFQIIQNRSFRTSSKVKWSSSRWKLFGIATAVGIGAGTFYSYRKMNSRHIAVLNLGSGEKCLVLKELPNVNISREVNYPTDASGLELILFQYPTCPFCCKVRAFLDFHGISYKVVEVNPVLRQQINWTDYKKVPILLVRVPDGYLQLNDSSTIISVISSYLQDREIGLAKVADFYPSISYMDDEGLIKKEILNRYFLMYHGVIPKDRTKEMIAEERKWRKWADDVLVHTLSPNVYRTSEEALQAFRWFSEVGQWDELFHAWENLLVIYVGAFAMWIISKRLKNKYRLKDDVRESLYDECNVWLREIKRKKTEFHGGRSPDLADLAVYGVLNSIEGCYAFSDLLINTKLYPWYSEMKRLISTHAGSTMFATT